MMNQGFWQQLDRPFTALAPMSGITDAAFRRITAKHGKPAVMFTEFVPADGLCSTGQANLLPLLAYSEAERPIVAQLHGGHPDSFYQAARLLVELGFDGIDLNMGCPSRAVESHGGGAVLINDPPLAAEIIAAAKAGAGSLPVSVKTRIGYRTNELETWLACLLAAQPAAITIHARTRSQGYRSRARWEAVAQAVALARELCPDPRSRPLIIGNGDVRSLAEARQQAAESGCDGVMLGRAAWGNPWCFSLGPSHTERQLNEVLAVLLEHSALYLELLATTSRPLDPMHKHFKAYITGFRGAAELRARLMAATDYAGLEAAVTAAMAQADACQCET
jgi:nifR3 family TIM-barrel protein